MAELGLVSDVGVRKAIEHLPAILGRGERVRCAATCFLEGRSGLVVATSRRLLFVYRDQTPIDVAYSDLRGFRAKAGVVAAELEIEDSVGKAVIRQIHPRGRLVELAALLNEPSAADPPPDTAERPSSSEQEAWRPRLRPKVSPLPARQPDPAGPPGQPELRMREVSLTRSVPASSSSSEAWRPRLADARVAPAPTPISAAGRRGLRAGIVSGASLPPPDTWMRNGEWLVAGFSEVLLHAADQDQPAAGSAVVTNRRTVFLGPDAAVREWAFGASDDDLVCTAPNRVRLPDGSGLDFADATTARDFSTAARAAADLARLPTVRAGEELS